MSTVPARLTTRPSPPAAPAAAPPADHGRPALRAVLPWLSLAARLVLAAVLGYAALTKLGDPTATVRAVRAYRLLPEAVAVPFAHALPPVELALAVLLLLGVAVRLSGVAAAVLMTMFIGGVASAAARGLQIDCGCFGGGGPTSDPQYTVELVRDGVLLALAVIVAAVPGSRLALDHDLPGAAAEAGTRRERAARAATAARTAHRLRVHRVVAVSLLALTALTAVLVTPGPGSSRTALAPAGATDAGGFVVGSAAAPHRLVVFEDMQCPVCGTFERVAGPVIARAVDAGTVSVEYRIRSFLGPESVRAAAALAAAADVGTAEFQALHAELFASQPTEHSGGYSTDELLAAGERAGIDDDAYREAVREQTYADWVRQIDDRASRDGNVGTPEVRFDGTPLPQEVVFDPARLAELLGA